MYGTGDVCPSVSNSRGSMAILSIQLTEQIQSLFLLSHSRRKNERLQAGKRKRISEVSEMENEGKISSRTPNPETKIWDLQQNISGLVFLYMPHTQEIASPNGLFLVGEESSFTRHFLHMICNILRQ